MKKTFLLLLLALSKTDCAPAFAHSLWYQDAEKLSGESEPVREHAVAQLKKNPSLAKDLRRTLENHSGHEALALDVISALKLKVFFPDLVAFSSQDETGMSYLALIGLTDASNHSVLESLFLARLSDVQTSSVSKMILLDALLRMNQWVPEKTLRLFLADATQPEVRSAALYYVRGMILQHHREEFLPLLEPLKRDKDLSSPFKTQLDFFLQELDEAKL